jgi:hypothetical protein
MADIRVTSCQYSEGVVTVECSYAEFCNCGKDVSHTGTVIY